jgi:uncharacterized glyoxalase superfamily protein PhnB
MTDPFEALREPVTPVDPDPGFTGWLRQRLTREVFASSGGSMSQQTSAIPVAREPAWPPTLTPYIMVSDARRAIDWYVQIFGAERRGEPHVNADGTIGHAEVGIGDAVLMLSEPSDIWPDVPVKAPDNPATFSHTLHLEVEDVDGTTERARRGGASVEREPTDQPYGRGSVIVDPFGHRWILLRPPARATRLRQAIPDQLNLVVTDMDASVAFYRRLGLTIPDTDSQWQNHHRTATVPNGIDLDLDSSEFAQYWNQGWQRGMGVLGFEVDSRERVDETYRDLVEAGYRGQQPPYDAFWGARYAVIEDPDGNAVGIMSPVNPDERSQPDFGVT